MPTRATKESKMAKMRSIAALLAAGTALAACGPLTPPQLRAQNPTIYSVNQPVVERTDYVLDLNSGGGGVSDAELLRLTAWFESLRVGYGDRIFVEDEYGAGRNDVARVAAEFGLLLSDGAPVTAGRVQPGAVRVVVSRSRASVPGCPNWALAGVPGEQPNTDPNFGCAMNSNIAAMIANPDDLVRGQHGQGGTDPRDGAKAVTSYRNRVLTGFNELKREKTSGDDR